MVACALVYVARNYDAAMATGRDLISPAPALQRTGGNQDLHCTVRRRWAELKDKIASAEVRADEELKKRLLHDVLNPTAGNAILPPEESKSWRRQSVRSVTWANRRTPRRSSTWRSEFSASGECASRAGTMCASQPTPAPSLR